MENKKEGEKRVEKEEEKKKKKDDKDMGELNDMLSSMCDAYGAWSAQGKPQESRDLDYYHAEGQRARSKYSVSDIQKVAKQVYTFREQYLWIKKMRDRLTDEDFPICRDRNAVNMLGRIARSGDIPIFDMRHLELNPDSIMKAPVGPCRDFLRTIYFLYSEQGEKESLREIKMARDHFAEHVFKYEELEEWARSKYWKDLFQQIKTEYSEAYAKHVHENERN